jgi:2-dehydropantoate 2-reductase
MVNVLVFGTGSIGSVYTCILSRAGVSVTTVCRSNYDQVLSHGIKVTSKLLGDLCARPIVVRTVNEALSQSRDPFDFIFVCTKATPQCTVAAIESIRPAVRLGFTAIVLIQNGLGVERPFHDAFPDTPVVSGVAYLPTTQISLGVFSHTEGELLYLGIYATEISNTLSSTSEKQLNVIVQQLKAGGATVSVSKDIQEERWSKILANGTVNPICALSRCRDRQLIDVSDTAAGLFRDVMQEIAAVGTAAGYGHIVTPEMIEKQLARSFSRPLPGVQPSMMADALASRPLEVQAILGEIVRIAAEKGVESPRLTTLFVLSEGLDFASQQAERNRNIAEAKS